ncbi:hypothetical protein J1785_18295 [Rahnella sp. SL6]|nr:SDR family oxidoreductase [Rahnella perminowiae]MBU9811671.1 hypothetical protein [Rahnella perminowiae]
MSASDTKPSARDFNEQQEADVSQNAGLASDESSYIAGAEICVDGGLTQV